jgi:DNA-directed RNA polymerase subunit RPC12/RpoP
MHPVTEAAGVCGGCGRQTTYQLQTASDLRSFYAVCPQCGTRYGPITPEDLERADTLAGGPAQQPERESEGEHPKAGHFSK